MLQHNDSDFPSQWACSAPSIVSYAELRMDDISSVRELLAELNNGGCGQATDLRSVRNISTCTALHCTSNAQCRDVSPHSANCVKSAGQYRQTHSSH